MFSPKFRKDGFTKIFETALNEKQITNNRVKGFIRQDMIKKQNRLRNWTVLTKHLQMTKKVLTLVEILPPDQKPAQHIFYLLK